MSTKRAGKDFLLQWWNGTAWETIAGQKSGTVAIAQEQADTTTKEATPWRQLSDCGTRTSDITIAGLIRDDTTTTQWNALMTSWMNGTPIGLLRLMSDGAMVLYGYYLASSVERAGEYNTAEQYNISFTSSAEQASVEPPEPPEEEGNPFAWFLSAYTEVA